MPNSHQVLTFKNSKIPFFDLCKAHVVSQHLHIFQVIPISPPAGSTHVFVSFMRLPPSLLFAFSFHSFIVIVYVIISYYLIKSLTKILSHSRKNGNCDKQLQSSNLQDKDKSTPYKPKPVYSCRQTRSHYKVQTVKIWNLFGLRNWNWLKIRRVWLYKAGYRLLFFTNFHIRLKAALYKVRIHLCWKK